MPITGVKVDKDKLNEAIATLKGIENGLPIAWSRALNSAVTGTQTDMVRMARDDYTYRVAAVKARMKVSKATRAKLTAKVTSKGQGVPLSDFIGTRQTKTGLSVNVKKSTGLQKIRHAFLAPGKGSGKILAFWRAAPGEDIAPASATGVKLASAIAKGEISAATGLVWRQPIVALYGPHPEVVWNVESNWMKLQDQADTRMQAAFAHEVDFVLQQYG